MNAEFVEYLIRNGVLRFGDFTLKSGRKSPYFFNAGMINSGRASAELGVFFAKRINECIGDGYDTVFGPAYKGIPLAVSTAIGAHAALGIEKTWLFDRKEAKEHGDKSEFVGDGPREGQRIIMVDDVFTTGGTKEAAIAKLSGSAKVEFKGIFIGVDRQERGNEKGAIAEFEESTGIKVYSIEKVSAIMDHLHNRKIMGKVHVDDKIYESFKKYMADYGA
jgi:orotate phosphoribosyltransferase